MQPWKNYFLNEIRLHAAGKWRWEKWILKLQCETGDMPLLVEVTRLINNRGRALSWRGKSDPPLALALANRRDMTCGKDAIAK